MEETSILSETYTYVELNLLPCMQADRIFSLSSPGGSDGKESDCNAGDLGSIPGLGRSPGGGNGNLLQYSCLENPMDRGAWWATVHRVAKRQTQLNDKHYHLDPTFQFSSVSSVAQSCPTIHDPMDCSTPGLPVRHQLPELLRLTSIESVIPSNHLILCHPLLLLPPISPSIRVFSNESTLRMRWPKYWSFSFSIIPSKEIPGLISFRMDWLDLLAVQGTFKTLLQHHSSKA